MELEPGKQGVPRRRATFGRGLACALLGLMGATTATAADREDAGLERLFDITVMPTAVVEPRGRHMLVVHERKLLDHDQLAAPVISLAGRDINPATHAPHAPLDYFGLTLVELATGVGTPIELPRRATIGFPAWAPDGSRFAFTVTNNAGAELWIGEIAAPRTFKLVDNLNASLGLPCTWMPDSRHVLCRRIVDRSEPRAFAWSRPPSAEQPTVVDERVARSLLESQLELIGVVSDQRRPIGAPTAFESVSPAPTSSFLLVTRAREPYPLVSGVDGLERRVEVWDRTGLVVSRLPDNARAAQWHPSQPATLVWIERVDGADRIMLQTPPFAAPAREVYRTTNRFSGVDWIEASDIMLVREYDTALRTTRVWRVDARSEGIAPRLLREAGVDTALAELGTPIVRANRWGKSVIPIDYGGFYVRGEGPAHAGARTFLAHVSLETGNPTTVWESTRSGYEEVAALLDPRADLILTRHESATEPPNYFVTSRATGALRPVTDYRQAVPGVLDAVRFQLTYARDDGYSLSSNLYLPPDALRDASLPLVLWAYPREVGATDHAFAPPLRERFFDTERVLKLSFLLRGYAVMDNVAMPIVGSSNANDTFIEQIVANSEAAIAAAAATGFVDPSRVGVAGHSYGAFMAGNLLAHSQLFSAGIALSGSYNRTLTPFGFQTERRTFWEAPDTYLAMSPLLYSNKISAPLLLVHGLEDKNPGTPPLQSTQFFQAIRGNGGQAELLLLPLEGHSYRARESVLRTATAMLDWFDRYL
jgi:dipeptidyl aminopeptidase/acylaminoacyl peptidase